MKIKGHALDDIRRFRQDIEHVLVFDVLEWDFERGNRLRLFITDESYKKAIELQQRGEIKIYKHAKVRNGALFYEKTTE